MSDPERIPFSDNPQEMLDRLEIERKGITKILERHEGDLTDLNRLRETPHLRKVKAKERRTIKKLKEIIEKIDTDIEVEREKL